MSDHLVVVQDQSDLLLEPVSIWDVLEDGAVSFGIHGIYDGEFVRCLLWYCTPFVHPRKHPKAIGAWTCLNMLSKGKGKKVVESANFLAFSGVYLYVFNHELTWFCRGIGSSRSDSFIWLEATGGNRTSWWSLGPRRWSTGQSWHHTPHSGKPASWWKDHSAHYVKKGTSLQPFSLSPSIFHTRLISYSCNFGDFGRIPSTFPEYFKISGMLQVAPDIFGKKNM